MQKNILLVEDDKEISELVASHLQQENFRVLTAFNEEVALVLFRNRELDLILLDLMLPRLSGMEVLKEVRATSMILF